MNKQSLKCQICTKRHHYTWLDGWNKYNWEKRPMTRAKFVCLSCVAKKDTRQRAYMICGWNYE